MLRKFASLLLVTALLCALGTVPAFAQSLSTQARLRSEGSDPNFVGKEEAQSNRSLKADISKLVEDAKAGKGLSVRDPQNQPAQSNSLSKGTKIAIAVGVAAAVILIILFVHARNHLFDNF